MHTCLSLLRKYCLIQSLLCYLSHLSKMISILELETGLETNRAVGILVLVVRQL